MNPGDLFPKVQSNPVILKAALKNIISESFRVQVGGGGYMRSWVWTDNEPLGAALSAIRAPYILSNNIKREFTTKESARVHGYPDGYQFIENKRLAHKLIGNSVPPPFMYSIARTLRERLFGNYTMSDQKGNEYLDILEAAWQEHLKPKESGAPTVISLFAGCGGSSLGYSMAGYRELLAVEWDTNAVATFKLNFPGVLVYHGDIHNLSVDECLELTGLEPGQLDVLDGSPPCQGVSTAGKRQMDDPRNQLYHEYVRLLRGLKPKVLIMENVSGLVKGKMKLIFADIMRELKASDYKVSCRLMNTMYFNVPQSRQRLIWIGVRKDLGIESGHPRMEYSPIGIKTVIDDAIATRSLPINPWIRHPRSAACLHTFKTRYQILTHDGIREPCIIERKKLCSFPKEFLFANDKTFYIELGNSVPPLFMKSIAEYVRTQLLAPAPVAAAVAEHRMT